MAAVFACQVIGSMCMIAPFPAEAATAVHQAQPQHPMGMGSMCAASLPSSPKSPGAFDPHAVPLADSLVPSNGVGLVVAGTHQPTVFPAEAGPPLYARLSTFRI
jgi:hypothetical protein